MLNSKLLFDYYAFVVSYWQKKFNASQYNIEVAFYQYALTTALAQQEKDNTELNRSLVDLETEAQNNYLYVCKQQRAGLVTDAAVETALNTWKDAKSGRRTSVPNPSLLITLLRDKAQSNFNMFDTMRRKIYDPSIFDRLPTSEAKKQAAKQELWDRLSQYAKDEYKKLGEWMTITQNLRDSVNTFEAQIQLFLETSEQSIDSIEDTKEAPITYQDIINESMYTFDGSYSDAANHISPTGQVTGQLQVILKVSSRIYWTGLAWLQMPDEIDQCANTSLLPADAEIGTIFRTPPATSTNSEWSYHYKTSEGWIPMVRLWDIDGWGNRPAHGTMIGEYHILIERNVPTIWTGYEKIRIPHSVLYDDIYGMHMPPGFITTFTDLQSSHNELAGDFLGFSGSIAQTLEGYRQEISEFSEAVGNVQELWGSISSGSVVTVTEAQSLQLLWLQLSGESEDIIDIAELLETVETTELTLAKEAYQISLNLLETQVLRWIGLEAYPVEITQVDRDLLASAVESEASKRALLVDVISKTNSDISASAVKAQIDEEIGEFTETLSGLNTYVSEILSDSYVTLVESQSLKLSLNLLVSESSDVIDIAEALVKDPDTINLESKITDYSEAILALQNLLGSYIDKTTYPIAITEQQRIDIDAAFSGVISARVALSKGISDSLDNDIHVDLTEYIGEVVSPINESIGNILTDISNISSNGYVSFPESETIRSAVVNIQSGCEDLIDIAELLETEVAPITEKSDLEDVLVALVAVTSPFIGQASYPIAITTQQRDDIQDSFVDTQTAKFKLIQKIQTTQVSVSATEVRGYIDEELGDIDSAISGLSTLATNTSSDGYMTLAEANSLKIALTQVQSESADIISIATANNITTEKTNYQSAIAILQAAIELWINRETYPIAILPAQRTDLVDAVEDVYATKTILRNAITTKLDSGVSEAINEIISGEVSDLNESIQGLSDNVTTWLSDDVVTAIEANSLKLAWVQVDSESTDVISVANTLGVVSGIITAYSGALSALYSQLSFFIDQVTYPIEITSLQRQGIADSFADAQSTKTTLLNAIETTRIQSTIEYVNQQVSELDSAISGLYNTVFEWVPGVSVSENESEDIASRLSSLTTEVNDVVSIATGLSITTETTSLSDSLDALSDLLLVYVDQLSYPVTLTSDDQQDILDAITDVRSKKTSLLDAINEKRLDDLYSYIDEQVGDAEEALAATNETVAKILSDDYVSLSEAQSLALSLERLDSETDTLVDLAQSLNLGISGVFDCLALFDTDIVVLDGGEDLESNEVSVVNNMTTEATEFETAIIALRALLTPWINQSSYPIAISQAQRDSITASFEDVELKRLALVAAIETYKNIDVSDYAEDRILNLIDSNDATTELLHQISSDGYVSYDESVSLQLSFITLEGECETLIDVAELLEVDATQLAEDLSLLEILVGRWVDLPNYPEAITEEDRSALANAYVALQISKTQIADAISTAKANGVSASLSEFQEYVGEELGEVNEAIGATNTLLTNSLSDGYITLKEANALKLSFNRLDSEIGDLVTIATGLEITTEATALTNAIDALEAIITTWTTKSEYPAVISSQTRVDITAAFTLVETTKVALVNAITVKLDNNLSTDISGYIDEQIGDVESAASDLSDLVTHSLSDAYVSSIEAQALRVALQTLQTEATDVVALATGTGIPSLISLANGLDDSLDTLISALSAFIEGTEEYPRAITTMQRGAIDADFADVQSKKTALVDALAQAKATIAYNDASFDISQFRQVYDGYIRGMTPELELVYVNSTELSLRPRYNDFDYLKVNDQNVEASRRTSVYTFTPVLSWNTQEHELYYSTLQPDTEYWVYLANRSDGFNLSIYDFRGRLFCSLTEPINNYLGNFGLSKHAILIGKAQTNSETKFVAELDVSLISRVSDMKETFREFSDFDLKFVNQDTLRLERIYGTYGQMFIGGSLYYLGENREVYSTSSRIAYDDDTGLVSLDTSLLATGTTYYVYIGSDSDLYNFNELNPATGLSWHPEDVGAGSGTEGPYYSSKDLRLSLFLCETEPQEGRLAESYSGYWTRCVGQVYVDGVRKFSFSPDISAIRQTTLSPTYINDMANVEFEYVSNTMFKVIRKKGTSGIVKVGGVDVYTFDTDNPRVHTITTDDFLYTYNEGNPSNPLMVTTETLGSHLIDNTYVYMSNDRPCWGALTNSLFISLKSPVDTYLSSNYPGNNARWIATLRIDIGTAGQELITNGNFDTSDNWTLGTGWQYNSDNKNVYRGTVLGGYATAATPAVCSGWTTVKTAIIEQTTPGDVSAGTIYHSISFDGGTTWKVFKTSWTSIVRVSNNTWQYYDTSTWVNATQNSRQGALVQATAISVYQWTLADIQAMSEANWISTGGWSVSVANIYWDAVLLPGTSRGGDGANNPSTTQAATGGTAFDGGHYGNYSAEWAFDNIFDSTASCYITPYAPNSTSFIYLGYDFGISSGKIINKIGLNGGPYGYFLWKLQGSNVVEPNMSNSSTDWVTLIDNTGNSAPYGVGLTWYTFNNYTAYRRYRFTVFRAPEIHLSMYGMVLVEAQTYSVPSTLTSVYVTAATGSPAPLSQSGLGIEAGETYSVYVKISPTASGSVVPYLGGVAGRPIYSTNTESQLIKTETTDSFSLVPTMNFSGTVDNIAVSKVTTGTFSSGFLVDGVVKAQLTLDNSTIGPSILWDSQKIMQVINESLGIASTASLYFTYKAQGLPLRLSYVDSNTIRLAPITGQESTIVFPDLTTRTIGGNGLTLDVVGSINTRYYVYLDATTFYMSTEAPDGLHNSLETKGTTAIQVGDVCLTSPDTMSSDWNVCSSHHEVAKQFRSVLTSSTVSSYDVAMSVGSIPISRRCYLDARMSGSFVEFMVQYDGANNAWSQVHYYSGRYTYTGTKSMDTPFGSWPGTGHARIVITPNDTLTDTVVWGAPSYTDSSVVTGCYYSNYATFGCSPSVNRAGAVFLVDRYKI